MTKVKFEANDGAQLNPQPFNEGRDDVEASDWAEKVATTSTEKGNATGAHEPPQSYDKVSTETTNEDNLSKIDTIKSAAHTAKQKLHLTRLHATGPFKSFNPTSVHVHFKGADDYTPARDTQNDQPGAISTSTSSKTPAHASAHEGAYLWRARDNRKGRNSIAVPVRTSFVTSPSTPLRARFTPSIHEITTNIWRMLSTFPYWSIAFWSGWSYSIGSILFIIDGVWVWRDVAFPGSESESLVTYGPSLCFFFGACLYQVGATMAYLEAVNDGSFEGSAMRRFLEGREGDAKELVDERVRGFVGRVAHLGHGSAESEGEKKAEGVDPEAGWRTMSRIERPGSIYPDGKRPAPRRGGVDMGEAEEGTSSTYMTWRWWPTWHALRTHHVYEIGYLACAIQLFGATLYGITGVVDLPGVLTSLEPWQEEGAFWGPQIVASACFISASVLFTLETQEKWWKPEPTVLGWWIGIWALIGSCGFMCSACFGAAEFAVEFGEYQADLSSTWGSAAYLTSGLLQWYEAVNKHPVEELFNEPGGMKSFQVHV